MKTLLVSLFLVFSSSAQTKISLDQIRPPAIQVLVQAADGSKVEAKVSIETSSTGPILRITLPELPRPAAVSRREMVTTVANSTAGVTLPWTSCDAYEVHKNGVKLPAGPDYTISGATIALHPEGILRTGDNLSVVCWTGVKP